MNGFWITGIAINVTALVVVLAWAVREWKRADAAQRRSGDDSRSAEPDA